LKPAGFLASLFCKEFPVLSVAPSEQGRLWRSLYTLENYKNNEEMILRDYLALDRTKLANERTLLAYIRTFIGLIASGIGLIEIIGMAWSLVLGIVFLALAPLSLFMGFVHYFRVKKKLAGLDK
jgi:putative membrane protein